MDTILNSYADAQRLYGAKHRPVKLAPNIQLVHWILPPDDPSVTHSKACYAVRVYGHDLIRYYPDGTFSVDDGGYNTPTTRALLNRYGPLAWAFTFHERRLVGKRAGTPPVYLKPSDRVPVGAGQLPELEVKP